MRTSKETLGIKKRSKNSTWWQRGLIIIFITSLIFFILLSIAFYSNNNKDLPNSSQLNVIQKPDSTNCEDLHDSSVGLHKLVKAYPIFLTKSERNFIIWNDGSKMIYDDGMKKTFKQCLDSADLEDQMKLRYPKGEPFINPEVNYDPGRFRFEPFFKKMYGASKEEVMEKLTEITWLPSSKNPKQLLVTTVNGIDSLLTDISLELDTLKEYHKFVDNSAGTFNFRTIKGTSRLSMHSFGIAIDINVSHSAYWKWVQREKGDTLRCDNKIPMKIVEIFERRGFIWGGRWYHFDTMHFEYRPELF